MRWIVVIMVIVAYYFILGFGLSFLIQDEFIIAEAIEGNTSLTLVNTSIINLTTSEFSTDTNLRSFPNALGIMFGFRTPLPAAIPQSLTVIISFINWFLLILLGTAVYRIINPIAAA